MYGQSAMNMPKNSSSGMPASTMTSVQPTAFGAMNIALCAHAVMASSRVNSLGCLATIAAITVSGAL
jgi:hypothetical protein